MRPQDIMTGTRSGVCCTLGDFHIDPTHPVERALITHAHGDHARPGHGAILATQETLDLMRLRYGDDFAGRTQAIRYGESIAIGGVKVSFHPAGHVLGSAQIAIARNGARIVASGDYKLRGDPTCVGFECLPCDLFITEATFGLPVFRHGDPDAEIAKLLRSVALFPERAHLVGAYTLGHIWSVTGKCIDGTDTPVEQTYGIHREAPGYDELSLERIDDDRAAHARGGLPADDVLSVVSHVAEDS